MNIFLGNLSVTDIENRAGVTFPEELKEYMKGKHQEVASNIEVGKWHCFDIPFVLVCGDYQTASDIYKHLAPLSKSFKQKLQISLSN